MISSMTGFGRGEAKKDGFVISVELRSLNHRFLDVDIRLPKNLSMFEYTVKELVGAQISRGRIGGTVVFKGEQAAPVANLTIDRALVATYLELLQSLKHEFQLNGEIEIQQLLGFPDIFIPESAEQTDKAVEGLLRAAVEAALLDLKTMRQREGGEIEKDLQLRVERIDELVRQIETHAVQASEQVYEKLRQRVAMLVETEVVDEGRLELEVALLAEKADITEECVRFKSHNTLFLELLANANSEGRKLNFLLQEMHREANTIGAKASDAEVAHLVVEIKEEVEKLREQIQNIE